MEGGRGMGLGVMRRDVDSRPGLMRDYRNPGMENWRFVGGTIDCPSARGCLMTKHKDKHSRLCNNDT